MKTCLLASLTCLVLVLPAQAEEPGDKLTDGWRKEVKVSKEGDTCAAWVKKGWLVVERKTAGGELDWQIVLAKASDPTPPEIKADPERGNFSLSYRDSRYFVREYSYYLRCLREGKAKDDKDWPRLSISKDGFVTSGSAHGIGRAMKDGELKSWFVVMLGPADDEVDCFVRLNHVELRGSGNGVEINPDFMRVFHGDADLLDDGSLLVSKRTTETHAKNELARREIRKNFLKAEPPEIDGTKWLNTDKPLPWSELKGKVVLVDFWGTWCGPCVKKLPHTEELYDKYKDQGLVVLGVHSSHGAEELEAFLKEHKIDFPVVVDAGKTAEQYAVDAWPTYFLVDRQGKIVWGFESNAPKDEKIEELLKGVTSSASSTDKPAAEKSAKQPEQPKIYDAEANASQQIAEALAKAGKENKRVLLQFGANWCDWCHKLHKLFESDPTVSEKIKSDYVVVMIDVDKDRNADVNKKYGQPTRFGLPAIVILDADGNQLNTKDSGELEEGDHHSVEKVMEYLNEWSAKGKSN